MIDPQLTEEPSFVGLGVEVEGASQTGKVKSKVSVYSRLVNELNVTFGSQVPVLGSRT